MRLSGILRFIASFALLASLLCAAQTVQVHVDASKSLGPLKPIWAYFGADEPNYSYAPHGRELIVGLARDAPGMAAAFRDSHVERHVRRGKYRLNLFENR